MFDIEGFVFRQFDNPTQYGSPATDWKVDCPFCVERVGKIDNKHKLHISMQKQVVHCFRCDYSKTWWNFVGDVLGTDNYIDIFSELYVTPSVRDFQRIQGRFTSGSSTTYPMYNFELPKDFQGLWVDTKNTLLKKARSYTKKRGFGKSYWIKYSLGVAQSLGFRLVIPIEDDYWQARSLFKQEPKYINPAAEGRYCIFNNHALDIYDEVVVCEGAFSSLSVGANSIALIRKKATTEQTDRLIKSKVQRFVLTVESGAFPSMDVLANTLRRNGKEVVLWCYDIGDPNDQDKPSKIVNYNLRSRVEMMFGVK